MKLRRIGRSLSARLLGIFMVTSLVYAVASDYAVQAVLDRDYLREIIGSHIALHTRYVLQDLGVPPDIENARIMTESNPMDIRIVGPGMDWTSDPQFPPLESIPFQQTNFFERIRASAADDDPWAQTLERMDFARYRRHSYVRVRQGDYEIAFVTPKIKTVPSVPDVTAPIIVGLVSILVLAACYFGVRWLIRPIKWIKLGAGRIGQGDLDYRIPKIRNDDLGDLTQDINRMADDVQEMLEAKRQLLLAISHELRSPLTRTKVALEFLDNKKIRQGILEDVEEMERLISDLLEGERLNTRHTKLQLAPTDLSELIDELVQTDFSHQLDRIKLVCPPGSVQQEVDAIRIRLLIKNLLDNALCYSPDDSPPVELTLTRTADIVEIRVLDHGSGMSASQAEQATEPFYRADPARCRDTGGFGLGLYLCRRIVEAHGGTLTIRSEEGQGTQVTVRLPGQSPDSQAA
jgi:signal transduction histidine kinase